MSAKCFIWIFSYLVDNWEKSVSSCFQHRNAKRSSVTDFGDNSFVFQNEKLKQEFIISRQQHQSCLEEVRSKDFRNVLISLWQNLLGPGTPISYFVWLLAIIFRSRPFAYLLRTRGQMAIDCIEKANLWLKMSTAGWKNRSEYYCMIVCVDWILIKL